MPLDAIFKLTIFICIAIPCFAQDAQSDEAALDKTDAAVRAAFANGDIDTIRLYHHPDVVKSRWPGTFLTGRDAVVAAIAANLQSNVRSKAVPPAG